MTVTSKSQLNADVHDFDGVRRALKHIKAQGVQPVGPAGGDLTGSYGSPTVAAGAITTSKLADASVTTAKIVDANVTTGKLADNAVTTVKITDANVTTAKILDANVTLVKLAAAVLALIPTKGITSDGPKAALSNITVTAQIKDGNGTTLAGFYRLNVWFSTSDKGAPTAGATFGTVTSGTILDTVSANIEYDIETDSSGKIVLTVTKAASGTLYIMASMPKVDSLALVWT